MANLCPELEDHLAADECLENFGGLGVTMYVFKKSDLVAPLVPVKNKYTLTSESFKSGTGLYKFECEEKQQGHKFESLGRRGGFKQTLSYAFESVSDEDAELLRALNNLDCGYLINDGSKTIIVYDKDHKFVYDSGAITGDTGKAPEDERRTTLEGSLSPTIYHRYVVDEPESGWDSLLASAKKA